VSDYIDRLNARAFARASGKDQAEIEALLRGLRTDLVIEPVPIADTALGTKQSLRVSKESARGLMSYGRDAAMPFQPDSFNVREVPDFTGYYLSENKLWGERGDSGFRLYRDGFIRPDGEHTQHYREKDLIYGPQGFQGFCFDEDWMCGPRPILPWNYQASKATAMDTASIVDRLNDRARRRARGELI
jgi:hypothetical protein